MKNKIVSIIVVLCFVIVSFFASLKVICFNKTFYKYEYDKNNVAANIRISDDDLMKATDVLLGYIIDKNDSLDIDVVVDNENVKMFNQREIDHMVDVKSLYLNVRNVAIVSSIIFVIGLLYIISKKENGFSKLYYYARYIYTLFAGVIGCLLIYACSNFNSFWNNFHHIFFNNDLWLLDPRTDRMILMVPSTFFFDLSIGIVSIFLISNFLFYLILRYKSRKELNI